MSENYISFDSDADYAGAEEFIKKEWRYIAEKRNGSNGTPLFNEDNIKGIALSGGGIRSASFCLGVMQALANKDKLKEFDYLSTVSGGGYLGGALSWIWSDIWQNTKKKRESFGVGKDDFPFGTEGRNFHIPDQKENKNQASLLRHLRQNGKYLTPGRGITALSFVSIIFRSITMGFVSLMALSGLLFSLFYFTGAFEVKNPVSDFFWGIGGQSIILFFLGLQFIYMILLGLLKHASTSIFTYKLRRWFEYLIPIPLKLAVICYLFVAIHWAQVELSDYTLSLELAGGSVSLGALLGSIGANSKWRKFISFIPYSLQLILAAVFMIFGLLVLSDYFVSYLITLDYAAYFPLIKNFFLALGVDSSFIYLYVMGISSIIVLLLASVLPINNISIHRYYRDRLMETFLPDVEKVLSGQDSREAVKANEAGVHKLKESYDGKVPYHLINTNIILVESEIAKFRGRGGDNFLLSPLYSGSNATGWLETKEFCGGNITIPSAVAISGAAANPDSGVAGQGLTTNPIISILMSIFNLRLGYWVSNPDTEILKKQKRIPSYLIPGFWETLKRNEMNEKAKFVQLSDGGHFENLALYELFRRRARLIIVCDAGADVNYEFGDLANAIEKARVDFGIKVNIERDQLDRLTPDSKPEKEDRKYAVAEKSYLIADIDYKDGKPPAKLIYIKTTLSENISADVHGYKRTHPDFPDETTADQFFDEIQFEAYRELGWQITQDMLKDAEIKPLF